MPRSQHLGWGDDDHDPFPDGIAAFNLTYAVLDNVASDDATRTRSLAASTVVNINNQDTPPAPPIRPARSSDGLRGASDAHPRATRRAAGR